MLLLLSKPKAKVLDQTRVFETRRHGTQRAITINMNLRKSQERRTPRRFKDELDQIYAPDTSVLSTIRPADRSKPPAFPPPTKPYNPNLPPAPFPSLPLDDSQPRPGSAQRQEDGLGGSARDIVDLTGPDLPVSDDQQSQQDSIVIPQQTAVSRLRQQNSQESLIVRLMLNNGTKGRPEVMLRDLVKQEDAREAVVWAGKLKCVKIRGFSDYWTLQQAGSTRSEILQKQYNVDSTLSSMENDAENGHSHVYAQPAGEEQV
ncbi:hypothetical protein MPH_08687 [Macrophomina phaseolina MS6]|uniref:Uncharacterized protein n=1 Tax=Macrophomina phaseolina (strain MS6) TaxID=1126212 RepID=K2QWI3_MACPH|nr:hypothetical protein MPH_08687 [Macrophomina phaseolina MS6]